MSTLRDRLDKLRAQGGAAESPSDRRPEGISRDALMGKLARMRVGAAPASREMADAGVHLADELECESTAAGVLVRRFSLPAGTVHGNAAISEASAALDTLLPNAGQSRRKSGIALLDCETTGLSGGTGTVAFMVGVAVFENAATRFVQFLIPRFAAESAMLVLLAEELSGIDVIVTYNGKSFDQPLLQTRFRLCGLAEPFSAFDHLDLLPLTRRLFARRWPDCRLATVEDRLLKFRRRDDLPGAEAPQAWLDWLRHGQTSRLRRVFDHNRWDLMSLGAMLPRLAETCVQGHPDADRRAVAGELANRLGPEEALRYLLDLGDSLGADELSTIGTLAKKTRNWQLAVKTWEELANRACPKAHLELAMYHEHRGGDLITALEWTERLARLEGELTEHRHRRDRLLRKIQGGPGVAGEIANLR